MQENGQSETKVFKATHMYAWALRLAELLTKIQSTGKQMMSSDLSWKSGLP